MPAIPHLDTASIRHYLSTTSECPASAPARAAAAHQSSSGPMLAAASHRASDDGLRWLVPCWLRRRIDMAVGAALIIVPKLVGVGDLDEILMGVNGLIVLAFASFGARKRTARGSGLAAA